MIKDRQFKGFRQIVENFPRGLPNHDHYTYFTLEDGIDGLESQVSAASQPFLGYYHFFPPHDPYSTRKDFAETFTLDDYRPSEKPKHIFHDDKPDYYINEQRAWYDEFILYVDNEFARLYHFLEQRGILGNTWLVLTSDHGELFERGILGHITRVLYQPVIHIPLLIFPPGQTTQVDVHEATSAIDLLPTLMHVTDQNIPNWIEGSVLTPFSASTTSSDRDVFAFHGSTNEKGQIIKGTAMIVRGNLKLIWYFGYEEFENPEMIELYDIQIDPEELNDLSLTQKEIADDLLRTLKLKLEEADAGYR